MGLDKVGALWLKDGKKGKFMSGEIEVGGAKVRVLVFKNTYHESGDKKPDYEVFVSDEEAKPERRPSQVDDAEETPF